MPCFKGLAVSIHTPDGPLPEYSIQKQGRLSRISSYIPVPQPQLNPDTCRTEPSTFAISITLLVPGQPVPYSRPASGAGIQNPQPKLVGSLMGSDGERGKFLGIIGPYVPLTSSPNETVAAYIHFDGRAKEEVATLLRRGEETWVNSRWVSVPESEGGGLAEREFLFREVGLERWLNGLDLKGESKEVAARVERRKRRLEKKRRKKLNRQDDSDDDSDGVFKPRSAREKGDVLRYGDDKDAPIQTLSDDDSMGTSDTDSEDEMPVPEAAGQIKVSLFRVLASGEVKKGEYSPQFDAHDDDEMGEGSQGGDGLAEVDHTTTFAKPKSLDPKSISTQTVTGIDPPNKPYAVFTFFYRGKKQLQKMGILPESKASASAPETNKKRATKPLDASSLKPLKSNKGTVGFTGYRDANTKPTVGGSKSKDDAMDSDDDDDDDDYDKSRKRKSNGIQTNHAGDDDGDDDSNAPVLSAEEVSKRGELAEGVKKIQLKRQHSFEAPDATVASVATAESSERTSEPQDGNREQTAATTSSTPPPPLTSSATSVESNGSAAKPSQQIFSKLNEAAVAVGSPFKKQRASLDVGDDGSRKTGGGGGGLFAATSSQTNPLREEVKLGEETSSSQAHEST